MKSPFATGEPFPPFVLTPEQERGCTQLIDSVVDETLREYDAFVHQAQRTLAPQSWKPLWTRENVTVYKQLSPPSRARGSGSSGSTSSSSSSSSSSSFSPVQAKQRAGVHGVKYNTEWPLPRLTIAGSILGSLDDALFGVFAFTHNETRIRSSYINDELLDHRVLQQLRVPTAEHPFQSLSIKWLVNHSMTAPLVRLRDTVYVERIGMHVLPSGERIGYIALHSVTLPQCPELQRAHGIVRGQLMSCYLYRAHSAHTVEVFAQSAIDPCGRVPRGTPTLMAIAKTVVGCWKNTWCGQNKKLMWMLAQATYGPANAHPQQRRHPQPVPSSKRCCSLCAKSLAFRSLRCCSLCHLTICSRCTTLRKLPYINATTHGADPEYVRFAFCSRCITLSARVNAEHIMRQEYVGMDDELEYQQSGRSHLHLPVYPHEREPRFLHRYSLGSAVSPTVTRTPGPTGTVYPPKSPWSVDSEASASSGPLEVQTSDAWEQRGRQLDGETTTPIETVYASAEDDPYHQQLWTRMNQLQVPAEETYQLVKRDDAVATES